MEAHHREHGHAAQPVESGNEPEGMFALRASPRGRALSVGAGRGSSRVRMCPLTVTTSVPQPPAVVFGLPWSMLSHV